MPLRIRIDEIYSREWIRIVSMEDGHPLKSMLLPDDPFYKGRSKGSPLGYIKPVIRDLQRVMDECNLSVRVQGGLHQML